MSWSSRKKKSAVFATFILSEGNFFNVCVLSQCIVYCISFQNIYTFTYQKSLLHTPFLLVLKWWKALNSTLIQKNAMRFLCNRHQVSRFFADRNISELGSFSSEMQLSSSFEVIFLQKSWSFLVIIMKRAAGLLVETLRFPKVPQKNRNIGEGVARIPTNM